MTVYLSQQNTPEQNFVALANHSGYPHTVEYETVLREMEQKYFAAKDLACRVGAVVLVVLGVGAAFTVGTPIGVFVAALAIVPVGAYIVFRKQKAECVQALERQAGVVENIVKAMVQYIDEKRQEKAKQLEDVYCVHSANIARDRVNELAAKWDAGTLSVPDCVKPKMAEHVNLRRYAKLVLYRKCENPHFNLVQTACNKFLFGTAPGCYLPIEWDQSRGCFVARNRQSLFPGH